MSCISYGQHREIIKDKFSTRASNHKWLVQNAQDKKFQRWFQERVSVINNIFSHSFSLMIL